MFTAMSISDFFTSDKPGTGKINSIFESIKIGHICVINKYVPNKNKNQN